MMSRELMQESKEHRIFFIVNMVKCVWSGDLWFTVLNAELKTKSLQRLV